MKSTQWYRKTARVTRTAVAIAVAICFSAAIAGAETVVEWNAVALKATAGQSPFNQARILATTQLAVFEAVNAVTGSYRPYLGTIVAPAGASAEAAAIAAAHGVLKFYIPSFAATLDAARASSLASIADGAAKSGGIATGEAAAAAMILARLNDGSSPPEFSVPASHDAGVWQLTPSCPAAGGTNLQWRNVVPFGIEDAATFIADPPPALTSTRYAQDLDEVKTVGSRDSAERPQDRSDVARFYASTSPAFVINLVARQVAVAQNRSTSHNARAFALVNMAISDAFVASFATKYHYNFWRPETAIHASGDATWTPFIVTPCFPSYGSNHAAGSYSGAEVLRRLYGAGGHSITMSNPAVPGIVFQYGEFKQITADIDDARVYGGIHFRFDQEAGARLGREVATAVYKNNLRAVHRPEGPE